MASRGVALGELSDLVNTGLAKSYTHHQKSVVCDIAGVGEDARLQLAAYVGGIDLTDGRYNSHLSMFHWIELYRYDSPDHPLWSSLATTHRQQLD